MTTPNLAEALRMIRDHARATLPGSGVASMCEKALAAYDAQQAMNTPNNAAALERFIAELIDNAYSDGVDRTPCMSEQTERAKEALLLALTQPDAITSQPSGGGEIVAWTVVGPDGKSSIGGWQDMRTHQASKDWAVLREGHRYAFATHPPADAPGVAVEPVRLEWSSTLCNGERVNYAKAEAACTALGEGWRLPTVDELFAIADRTRHSPAIDETLFPNTKDDWYWTSTITAWSSGHAWVVNFDYGYAVDCHRDGNDAFVRAVRAVPAGQSPAKENGSE